MSGLRIASASGNWSSASIWLDGILPTVGDIVASNGFTVNIDQDINVAVLTNTSRTNDGVVPVMSSPILPVGYIAAASSENNIGTQAYHAFDNMSTAWLSLTAPSAAPQWISIKFPTPIIITRYTYLNSSVLGRCATDWIFEASNDGSTWAILETKTNSNPGVNNTYVSPILSNSTPYLYYRIRVTATAVAGTGVSFVSVNLYKPNYTTLTPAIAGGTFTVSGSRTLDITGDGLILGTANLLTYSSSAGTNTTINGTINCRAVANGNLVAVVFNGSGTLNVVGNILPWNNAQTSGRRGIDLNGAGTLNITGILEFGYNAAAVTINGAGSTLNINGAVGNVAVNTEPSNAPNRVINVGAVSTLNITGDVYGNGINANGAVNIFAAATVNITGNIYGGSGTGYGILTSANSYLNIIGGLYASRLLGYESPAVVSTSTTAINIFTGPFISGPYGGSPLQVFRMHYIPTSGSYFEYRDNSTNGALFPGAIASASYLYAPSTVISAPNQNDVRFGTVYASGSQTGQMRVPLPSQVSVGIPVDNTVGTAVLSANDVTSAVWNSSIAELTASNSIGNRLKNVSTPDITANQIIGLI